MASRRKARRTTPSKAAVRSAAENRHIDGTLCKEGSTSRIWVTAIPESAGGGGVQIRF